MPLPSIADDRWSNLSAEERNKDLFGRLIPAHRVRKDTIYDKIRRQMPHNAPADFEALIFRIITRAEGAERAIEALEVRIKNLEERVNATAKGN